MKDYCNTFFFSSGKELKLVIVLIRFVYIIYLYCSLTIFMFSDVLTPPALECSQANMSNSQEIFS